MATKKKTAPKVPTPKQIDTQKKAKLEARIQELATERNEVADEIAALAQSENDISEIPTQVLFNLYGKRHNIERQMAELQNEIITNCFVEEEEALEDDIVAIGDIITIHSVYGPDPDEQETFIKRLVSSNPRIYQGEVEEISIESPLGKALYKKRVGETVDVIVNNKTSVITYKATVLKKE